MLKIRKNKFWVLKCEPYLYIFDSEEDTLDKLAKFFLSGECKEITKADMYSIEATEKGFMVRGMDWRRIALTFARSFDKYNEERQRGKQPSP